MIKEKVLSKLEQSGIPLPGKPKTPQSELFADLPAISDLPEKNLGALHASFAGWYIYANYLKMRAELEKMDCENAFQREFYGHLLEVNPDVHKNVTERKAVATHKSRQFQEKLQEAEASCLALDALTHNLETAMKTVSREISRRQFVNSAAHNLSL